MFSLFGSPAPTLSTLVRSGVAAGLALVATALAAGAQTMPPSSSTPAAPPSAAPMASASPSAAPSPIPTPVNPPENPLITERVRKEFAAWQHGRIDRASYSPQAAGTYIDPLVAIVAPDLAIGEPQSVAYGTTSLVLGDFVYRYEVTGTGGTVSVLYSLDSRGKTDGIVFTPRIFTPSPTPSPIQSPTPAPTTTP